MANQDLTTYTEVDSNNRLTVISSKVTFAGLQKGDDAWVYYDFGANYFDGDFEHLLEVYLDASDAWGFGSVWALTNTIDGTYDIAAANGDYLIVAIGKDASNYRIQIRELDGGTKYSDTYVPSLDTLYYLKVKRDEAVGTYGTLYCYIYDDADRTSLVDTLTITLHSSKKDFRYFFALLSHGQSGSSATIDGYGQNHNLQEVSIATHSHGYIIS